jgi:multidrug resistance efflux pump
MSAPQTEDKRQEWRRIHAEARAALRQAETRREAIGSDLYSIQCDLDCYIKLLEQRRADFAFASAEVRRLGDIFDAIAMSDTVEEAARLQEMVAE